jgi:hypothetical protein
MESINYNIINKKYFQTGKYLLLTITELRSGMDQGVNNGLKSRHREIAAYKKRSRYFRIVAPR